jgi:hypothetical protein
MFKNTEAAETPRVPYRFSIVRAKLILKQASHSD